MDFIKVLFLEVCDYEVCDYKGLEVLLIYDPVDLFNIHKISKFSVY